MKCQMQPKKAYSQTKGKNTMSQAKTKLTSSTLNKDQTGSGTGQIKTAAEPYFK